MTRTTEAKNALRRDFPGWSIITSDAGRWWATRGPEPGQFVQPGKSCFEADDPDELRARLAEATS